MSTVSSWFGKKKDLLVASSPSSVASSPSSVASSPSSVASSPSFKSLFKPKAPSAPAPVIKKGPTFEAHIKTLQEDELNFIKEKSLEFVGFYEAEISDHYNKNNVRTVQDRKGPENRNFAADLFLAGLWGEDVTSLKLTPKETLVNLFLETEEEGSVLSEVEKNVLPKIENSNPESKSIIDLIVLVQLAKKKLFPEEKDDRRLKAIAETILHAAEEELAQKYETKVSEAVQSNVAELGQAVPLETFFPDPKTINQLESDGDFANFFATVKSAFQIFKYLRYKANPLTRKIAASSLGSTLLRNAASTAKRQLFPNERPKMRHSFALGYTELYKRLDGKVKELAERNPRPSDANARNELKALVDHYVGEHAYEPGFRASEYVEKYLQKYTDAVKLKQKKGFFSRMLGRGGKLQSRRKKNKRNKTRQLQRRQFQ